MIPTNEPHPDPARLQGEALFARKTRKKKTRFHTGDRGDPTFKIDRSTKAQADAYFDGKDPSLPVTAPEVDTSKAVARESDLAKHPATLLAERDDALRRGDKMRATELQRAMRAQHGRHDYKVVDDRVEDTELPYSPANTRRH